MRVDEIWRWNGAWRLYKIVCQFFRAAVSILYGDSHICQDWVKIYKLSPQNSTERYCYHTNMHAKHILFTKYLMNVLIATLTPLLLEGIRRCYSEITCHVENSGSRKQWLSGLTWINKLAVWRAWFISVPCTVLPRIPGRSVSCKILHYCCKRKPKLS
jgi:hypothetical protein